VLWEGGVVKVLQWLCTRVEAPLSVLVLTGRQRCLLMGVVVRPVVPGC